MRVPIRLTSFPAFLVATATVAIPVSAQDRPPVIDVHLHAYAEADWRAGAPNPAGGEPAPATAAEHMRRTLEAMERHNIVAAAVSGPIDVVEEWRQSAPERILAAPVFGRPGYDDYDNPLPTLDSLRTLYEAGRLRVMDFAVVYWIGGERAVPRFHQFLRDMFAEGLGKRLMFGTDQMRWPDAIGMGIEAVESADFLTDEQKRDLLHDNAARFLGLSVE